VVERQEHPRLAGGDVSVSSTRFLPYGRQCIDEDDVAAVAQVLRSDRLTTGPVVGAFEDAFAARTGAVCAAACANGTAALHLAALALGLGPGDRAIVPAVTFLATANAVRFTGAEIVFADVDPETGLMLPQHAQAALAAADGPVKAVFPVHLNGQTGDPAGLAAWANENGIRIVEDASHAIGTHYRVGNEHFAVGACAHADLATFSFHPVKTIASGEGGMVTSRDASLIARVRQLRNHGMVREPDAFLDREQAVTNGETHPWYYEMHEPGFNYRLSDIHCALGLSQLGKLDAFAKRRRALATQYDELIAPLAPLARPIRRVAACDPVWHLYVVRIDFAAAGIDRGTVMRRLEECGIGTQVHYLPLHRQPYYRQRYGDLALPGAEAYYECCLSLPLFPDMEEADVDNVVDALRAVLVGRSS
jgi:UDP-4-amino-4,6-dideoxy-N-acetyl-beta-L-altrosamine transaminase